MIKVIIAFIRVWKFFRSFSKARKWFRTPNPLLGYIEPKTMIEMGRIDKLYNFIDNQLKQNKR